MGVDHPETSLPARVRGWGAWLSGGERGAGMEERRPVEGVPRELFEELLRRARGVAAAAELEVLADAGLLHPSVSSLPTQRGSSLRHQNSRRRRWLARLRRLGSCADELVESKDLDLLGDGFWECFRINRREALAELLIDMEQAQRNFDRASERYSEAETVLQERRANDFRLVDILERSYGRELGL